MPAYRVMTDSPDLSALDRARQLGQRCWQEPDAQLDFSGVESVTPEFAATLCQTILERCPPGMLQTALVIETMTAAVRTVFVRALMGSLPTAASPTETEIEHKPPPPAAVSDEPGLSAALNPLDLLRQVQDEYLTYVHTFQRFRNPALRDWVADQVRRGTLLWKEPYVQVSRPWRIQRECKPC